MTTPAAARLYEAQHLHMWDGVPVAIHNPHNKPTHELPVIYGFNNGGCGSWLDAQLISESGECLGGHLCSSESYMPHDLGVLKGSRPDRHEAFRSHYPDGYRMEFVPHEEVPSHEKLKAAIAMYESKRDAAAKAVAEQEEREAEKKERTT